MPIRGPNLPYKIEDWVSQGPAVRYYYLEDPVSGEYLSTHLILLPFGRNQDPAPPQYYRGVANVVFDAGHGYPLGHNGRIVGIAARSDNTPANVGLEIKVNGTTQDTVLWNSQDLDATLGINFSGGSYINIEQIDISPGTRPVRPIADLYIRWRL